MQSLLNTYIYYHFWLYMSRCPKKQHKTVLYSEIKQKDQQLYTTCFPLFFQKHLENLKLCYNLINAEKFI